MLRAVWTETGGHWSDDLKECTLYVCTYEFPAPSHSTSASQHARSNSCSPQIRTARRTESSSPVGRTTQISRGLTPTSPHRTIHPSIHAAQNGSRRRRLRRRRREAGAAHAPPPTSVPKPRHRRYVLYIDPATQIGGKDLQRQQSVLWWSSGWAVPVPVPCVRA